MGKGTLLLILALGALRDPCGTDTSPEGLNAACTRTSDCEQGLDCVGGVCAPPDSGTAEGGADSSADAPGVPDGNTAD